jgi:membrane-bound lytic murein transglycosylase A
VAPPAPVVAAGALVRLVSSQYPSFDDEADLASLRTAAIQSAKYYRGVPAANTYRLGVDTFTAVEMADSLQAFADLVAASSTTVDLQAGVRERFDVYQSVGTDADRSVLFTAYFEPAIPARLKKNDQYRFPLYGRPDDLIDVDLGRFNQTLQGTRISGRRQGKDLVPYYTRAEIDSKGMLKERSAPLAYAKNPLDVFSLQTEGSGWLELGGGERVRIRYAGNNGHKYRSVGQYLISSGRIPKENFNYNVFQKYMDSRPVERQEFLNVNERYVFFRLDRSSMSIYAYGNIDVPLTAGRSIATDPKLFPKGGLAWIEINGAPKLNGEGPAPTNVVRRFMMNQDEGGAIQGPGRVDFFAGSGESAERFAKTVLHRGKLFFLMKKRDR